MLELWAGVKWLAHYICLRSDIVVVTIDKYVILFPTNSTLQAVDHAAQQPDQSSQMHKISENFQSILEKSTEYLFF